MRKYRNRLLAGFAIVFAVYVALLLFTNTGELVEHLVAYPWALLIPVVLLKLLAWACRFWQWDYYLGVIGARDRISRLDSAVIFVSGFMMTVSPGKAAEVLKSVALKVKTGIPIAVSAPVVLAERVNDGVAVIVVAFLAVALAGPHIDLGPYSLIMYLATGMLVFGLIAVQIRPLAYLCLEIIGRIPLLRRIHQPLVTFYESSREIFRLRHVVPTALMGAVAYLGDAIGFTIILTGFGLEFTWVLFLQATFIVGFAAAVGALSGVPNGAGVTEISTSGMLLAIVAPQNPEVTVSIAATAALIEGFFHKWFRVLAGLVTAVIFRHRLFPAGMDEALSEDEPAAHPALSTEGEAA